MHCPMWMDLCTVGPTPRTLVNIMLILEKNFTTVIRVLGWYHQIDWEMVHKPQ